MMVISLALVVTLGSWVGVSPGLTSATKLMFPLADLKYNGLHVSAWWPWSVW